MTSFSSIASPRMADTSTSTVSQQATNLFKVAGAKGVTMERIDKVAKDFEMQFISQMMETMFSTIDKSGDDITGSQAEETFQSMLTQEYGKIISRTGGIGISSQIKASMLRMQEVGEKHASVPTPAA